MKRERNPRRYRYEARPAAPLHAGRKRPSSALDSRIRGTTSRRELPRR